MSTDECLCHIRFYVLLARFIHGSPHPGVDNKTRRGGGGASDALNTAHIPQYSPRSIASRDVLRDLGRIEERGQTLKCFLVLLSDYCRQITCFHAYITLF